MYIWHHLNQSLDHKTESWSSDSLCCAIPSGLLDSHYITSCINVILNYYGFDQNVFYITSSHTSSAALRGGKCIDCALHAN